jgi:hypothetical protein
MDTLSVMDLLNADLIAPFFTVALVGGAILAMLGALAWVSNAVCDIRASLKRRRQRGPAFMAAERAHRLNPGPETAAALQNAYATLHRAESAPNVR